MRTIQSQTTIHRPTDTVWAILSDLTAMREYMPGVQDVHFTSEHEQGVGAARHCTFDDGIELHEEVIQWEPGRAYTLQTTKAVKVPMRENEVTFSVAPQGAHTVVTQTMRYQMKGGILAPLMEMMAKGMMRKAMDNALQGLKAYAETQPAPVLERG